VKKALLVLAGFAVAVSALAQLTKYKDWDKSAEAYFLTPAERTEWKNVGSDADAEKFIALYYAKRGGEPFKQEIARRIAAADQQFKSARYKRGSDSVRGHLLVVLGPPSRQSQSRAQEGGADLPSGATIPSIDVGSQADSSSAITYTWTWDKDRLPPAAGVSELKASIVVDPRTGGEELRNGSQAEKAMSTLAEKSIVNPNATLVAAAAPAATAPSVPSTTGGTGPAGASGAAGAPAAGGAAAGAGAAGAAAAPAAVLPLPAAAKSALAASKPSPEAGFWSGPFRTIHGESFLAIQFYLPADKPVNAGGAPLKYGAVITDESGKEVQSVWEEAKFSEVAEGSRKDRVLDKSVALPPGSYKGTFGLFTDEGQPPVASASASFKLDAPTTDFEVSPLILSSGLVPLTRRPAPTDPFIFGTEKPIKVEPKGDKRFSKQDSLWYFYAIANASFPAGSAPDAGAAAPAPAATPAAGAAAPAAPAADAPKPRIMTRINVQRDGQDAFAPFTGPADMQPISGGHYGTGSEIPLASFEPGYYTFAILVRDLNAAKGSAANKGVERKEDFVVVMPDGSLPPKKAAGAAPAAKPTPKKS
jgi:GWxTD domain-containing protein